VWQGIGIGLRLMVMMLLASQLCSCWTTFSTETAAKPVESYRTSGVPDENRAADVPTPQLFNFGFDLPKSDPGEP
jgi:hypothetical protein